MALEARQLDRRSAADLRVIETRVRRSEDIDYAGRMRLLGSRIRIALVAERDDVIEQAASEVVYLSERRLAQLGGDAA